MRLFLLVLLGFLSLGQTVLADDSFKVWAFNLRYASNSKPNAWPDRLPVMANLINEKNPDIIGTQEGKFYQLKELNKKIPEYTWFGTGRDGGSRGEFMAIFYKANRFDIMKYDHVVNDMVGNLIKDQAENKLEESTLSLMKAKED